MTDTHKYRNVSLTHETHGVLIKLSKALLPDAKLSISKTIESLANEKVKELKTGKKK
jgi:ribosomal protein S13|tara:strand:+ start:849 stop:1019 length:171 start_codon:yes stop_codon:yes gene_type:complete